MGEGLKFASLRQPRSNFRAQEALKYQTQWQDTALHPAATAPTPFTFTPPVLSTASPQQVSELQCGSSCFTERDTTCQYCLAGDTHGSIKKGRSIATRKAQEEVLRGMLPRQAPGHSSWRCKGSAM
ncbi:hypothetical protein NU195Hw_g8257t1 [Hortaea werneckii]